MASIGTARIDAAAGARNFAGLTTPHGVAHQPGLDGLRGLAVAAVVAFHTELGVLPGGYLGVSLFFTLSGVVIGTVILHELSATGRFSLRRFWARRARRLLPAAWVVLAVLAVGLPFADALAATSRSDVAASWLNVANWHFLSEESYGDLFRGPSALLHFWSLAIEEQFYLVVGLLAVGVAAVSRRPANLLGAIAATGAVISFTLPLLLGFGVDRTYYGTDTRAGELLVGLVIAAVLSSPDVRRRVLAYGRLVAAGGLGALALVVALWATLGPASPALRMGMLPLVTLTSTVLTLAALVPRGVVWRLATLDPLCRLGRISYGVYLVHWPLSVITEQALPSAPLRAVVVVPASIAIAALSARLLELPIRRRTVAIAPMFAAAVVVAAVVAASLVLPTRRSATEEFLSELEAAPPLGLVDKRDETKTTTTTSAATPVASPATGDDVVAADGHLLVSEAVQRATESTTPSSEQARRLALGRRVDRTAPQVDVLPRPPSTTAATTTTTAPPPVPLTVALFGDSVALSLSLALPLAAGEAGFEQQAGVTDMGCGVALTAHGGGLTPCSDGEARAAAAVQANAIDVAVVMSCQWELLTQQLPGDSVERGPGDPVLMPTCAAPTTPR